ncbi:SIS domain-containing protein [Reyranella sp. CPCC 100927]|uniref:KpsF/GutQ family sugar-phosphate isomerase n=1 Tax=Reyranella sp. CPCC 100927 TaxID=2599616 RepID=UPI0011B7F646|nr:KpsF/GutQ family sugar-phosphate isomerase [Reyranella sp. CPCC 100927]TWT15096.1 KpsF/GutQ family sugar-phosphate isomerase [Reyranella sp. CPCC 100927]
MKSAPRVTPADRSPPGNDHAADATSARRVLATEIAGLQALQAALGDDFGRALDILESGDRVIVSGMGKSGHVGRKIAATLASTGTPAYFVHPAEASHGDLGMIASSDVVLALSNSGETSELSGLLWYAKRFGIRLVAITSGAESNLAQAADVALVLPGVPEACPMGLAPTTSTTMTLALGDAIAIALLERKGFTPARFGDFHPGGRLGQRLVKVADLMHVGKEVPAVSPDTSMAEALIEMSARSFGCVAVIDPDRRLLGIITDGDLRRHMNAGLLSQTASEIMTARPKTIAAEALAAEAVRIMNATGKGITSLFVVGDDDRLVGLVHVHDCLRAGVA